MKIVANNMIENKKCRACDIAFFCHYMKCGYINYLKTGYFNLPSDMDCKFQKMSHALVYKVFQYVLREKRQLLQPCIDYAKKNNIKLQGNYE